MSGRSQQKHPVLEPATSQSRRLPPPVRTQSLSGVAFWAAVIGLLLLSAALGWYGLDTREVLGMDENVTIVKLDQPSLAAVLDTVPLKYTGAPSNTQPLYFLLEGLFWPLVGRSAFMLRFLSSVFGVLTVALTYKLGEVLFGRLSGLAGALFTALLPMHLLYAQIARPYTLLAVLSLASALFLVQGLRTNRPRYWAGFVLSATLCFYTHFNALLVLAAEGIFAGAVWLVTLVSVLKREQSPRRLLWMPLGFLLVFVLCAPGLVRLMGLDMVEMADPEQVEGGHFITLSWPFFRYFMELIGLTTGWLRGLILGFMALGLIGSLYRRLWQAAWFSTVWTLLPFMILAAIELPRPFLGRYVIFVTPVALLLVGQGVMFGAEVLNTGVRRWGNIDVRWAARIALLIGVTLVLVKPAADYYASKQVDGWLEVTLQTVERQARPGDIVIVSPRSFARPLALQGADGLYLAEHSSPAELDDLASRYQRMWILYTTDMPPEELQEPLDQWVQAQPDSFVKIPIKAVNWLAIGTLQPASAEEHLKDLIPVLEDLAQNSAGARPTQQRHEILASAYQTLADLYEGQGESTLAAEYRRKAEEARAEASPP
jgi:hypothetical protein